MNRPPRFGNVKYEMPTEPRSTTEIVLRQLALFAIMGGIVLLFYVMGFWDELIAETKRLLFGTKPTANPGTPGNKQSVKDTAKNSTPIESKKDT